LDDQTNEFEEEPAGREAPAEPDTEPADSDTEEDVPEPDEEAADSNPPAPAELAGLVESLQQVVQANITEIARLREHLTGREQESVPRNDSAQEDVFLSEFKDAYEKDPVQAIAAAIDKGKRQSLEDSQVFAHKLLGHHRIIRTAIDEMLSHPKAVHLKPHRSQIEFLVMEKGLDPVEAVATVASTDEVRSRQTSRRSVAAKEIRNRSDVETGGEAIPEKSADRDLDRALRNAKTLDEMFANLRKLKV
jgi:hypothetical protein